MTDYKGIHGGKVQNFSTNPPAPILGQVWYNSTLGKVRVHKLGAGAWSSGTNFPRTTSYSAAFGTSTAAVWVGGYEPDPAGIYYDTTVEYDGSSWTESGDIGTAAQSLAASGPQTSTLCFGGNPASNKAQSFDGTTWTQQSNLSTGREQVNAAGASSSSSLCIGGLVSTTIQTATEEYSFTTLAAGTWASGENLNTARDQVGNAGASSTNALAFGGTPPGQLDITESYDGSSWTEVGDLNTTRRLIDGIGTTNTAALAAGGYDDPGYQTINEIWNGTSWTEGTDLNSAHGAGGSAGTSTSGLVFAGAPGGPMVTCESWDGSSWTEVADLSDGRRHMGSAGTTNTAAIGFGGDTPGVTANTEVWNGTSWTEVNNLNTAREQLTGAGTSTAALAIGGDSGSIVAIAEEFDGVGWTEVADLSTAREDLGGAGTTNTSAVAFAGDTPGVTTATEEWTKAQNVKVITD